MADLKQDKNAMARTLGAAFLNHQVEELSKKTQAADQQLWPRERRGSRGGGPRIPQRNARQPRNDEYNKGTRNTDGEHSCEREDRPAGKKDANVVVVDASVLVHALGQLKAWCRNGREEVIIVPLEALNTLDLLKKGTSPLAHRARAASRILEQQVGTNPRIKVQRDEAYVLWDNIPFAQDEQANDEATSPGPPEWLRRTISCARWEFDHAEQPAAEGGGDNDNIVVHPPMTVAVCLETATIPVPDTSPAAVNSPVPLPPPQASKYEQRCSGALVAHWAKQAGMHVLECKATPLPQPPSNARHARVPSDEDWRMSSPPRNNNNASSRPKPGSVRMKGPGPIVEKPNVYGPGRGGGALVERPAATMAMNASMMQMSKPIRVLARGEKLEP
ncbi:uncharacterized protein FOMMEDRAFT_136037 [Fomitiporia mediterranea MF3/22]|uniref:uncharacterized protein n=1 Tax=Fomitiporia mediterranea (strain MF3/22) TaxID=694068 RepID=UPI000440968E|nr:uncharacterized protein FOMMEDRAFT_136037 [Fomitiporia mediterranea MF3/22]EJD00536.1 hypothetical protein FOMMEDRAFT_136037 [Fomitiporia mediterranea MF3/22]